MKKNCLKIICLLISITAFSQKKELQKITANGKKVIVYTTADSTQLRLTKTDHLIFTEALQPLETEVSIFVEPNKTFQTFLGIGGAISDASAEVFAKINNKNF